MADQELKVKISVDPDTGALKIVRTELDLINRDAKNAGKGIESLSLLFCLALAL
ncbi:MAG: hypothetical protein LBF86_07015 [Helicobacteraceae bacterium]|jgi:hypothetical protein|nr:hypothetical protein [Helicobacteraceae bacterium]